MRVKLVVTGDVEKLALKKSLERYFQETSSGARVEFLPPRKVHGITTYPLKPLPPDEESSIPRDVEAMARAVVAEVCEGADGKPADLVVAIDDLEIANHFEPHRVTSWVRRGMEREIARRSQVAGWGFAEKLRRRVRERCSFHLLVPMIEAYFFAEEAALQRIGVSSEHPPRLTRRDVEHFETDDPMFLPIAQQKNAQQRANGYTWWCHERHPKHYLEHLCNRSGRTYGETSQGRDALAELGWPSLPADELALAFARALFEDIADFCGIDNPMGPGQLASATYPAKTTRVSQLLLRNL